MASHITHRRQYKRRSSDVRVQLVISEDCRTQVSPLNGPSISGRMKDVSGDGAYVVVSTYLPRAVRVELEIPPGTEVPAGCVLARVMKVRMVDREPRYGVGLQFEDADSEIVQALRSAEEGEARE